MDIEEIKLTDKLLQNFAMGKVFKDHQKEINSIDFSKDGKRLVSCDDQVLNLYDCEQGKKIKTLFNKTKEIEMVKFTHHNEAVLCATKKEYQILYWSLHENEVIKIFTGHQDQILSLDINPQNDSFITTSKDQTFRFWNLTQMDQGCEALLDLSSKNCYPIAAFDPCGLIFAIAYTETLGGHSFTKVALYDVSKYEDGCFENWKYNCPEIKIIKFSSSGNNILCATSENSILIIDAFQGLEITEIKDFQNDNSIIEASFSPCSNYVISGSETGLLKIWETKTGKQVSKLEGHFLKCQVVKFSPLTTLIVSGCKNLIFWIPKSYE